ncbi:hypothetical protein OS493_027590 [Desmophyllum pertusum]|uniref:Sushi domain-containing protein n=1 Tax=Desmophyllum pertusum TaxID=174260 RepID=A0A9W9ZYY1_9CNID|nr:hypothetical protein OS493_027590 [Desmophyllum pertusum]
MYYQFIIDFLSLVITSRVQVVGGKACGHIFKYKTGSVTSRSLVTKAWGYFLWASNSMYISSSGGEGTPRINYSFSTGAWYDLKSVIDGTNVKIYINGNLVKEITISGSEADAKSNNYVGLWCHGGSAAKPTVFKVMAVLFGGSSNPSCSALTVGNLVKTTPNGCVTSQMTFNSRCSFSCAQGYQLQGPSSKQCGPGGQWSDSAKSVSCTGEFYVDFVSISQVVLFHLSSFATESSTVVCIRTVVC